MNTNLTAADATEHPQRLITEAANYRRGNAARTARKATPRYRVTAFLKDVVAASL